MAELPPPTTDEAFDYEAADALLATFWPDQIAEDEPDDWRMMVDGLLEQGGREAAIRWWEGGCR